MSASEIMSVTPLDGGPDEKKRAVSDPEPGSEKGGAIESGTELEPVREEAEQHASNLPFSKARCIALVATVTGASFLNTVSIQSVVILLPTIGREFDIPDTRVQWVVSSYTLTFGCFLLLWGRIGDIYGKRKVFVWGSVWVAVTTAINPFLPNEIAFDVFRGLQGLGAAANVPTALGILGATFPPGKAKNYAFSTYAAGAPLGSVFGNILAGFIVSYTSWKWMFGIVAIMAAAVSFAGMVIIPPPKHTLHEEGASAKASIDWVGAGLITLGMFALLFALTEGNVVGWATPWVPVLIVVSLVLIACFVFWQRHLERTMSPPPLLKISVFKSGRFSAAMVIMALFFSSFNGFLVYATYYFQDYQGLSPLQTTLRFIPTGVTGVITAAVVSQFIARVPTYMILLFGNVCVSLSSLLFAVPIPPSTTYFAYGLPAMILCVLGADTTWPSLTLYTSHSLPQKDQALGGALVNSMGQIGRSIGLAIATAIQTTVMARQRGVAVQHAGPVQVGDDASLKGIQAVCWFHFALAIVSMFIALAFFRGAGIVGKHGIKKPADEQGQATEMALEGSRIPHAEGLEEKNGP